jgi:hypothetical protein
VAQRHLGIIGRKLQRALGLDDASPLHSVGPELVPVSICQDLTSPLEHDAADLRLCVGTASMGAVVGEYSHAQLFNPAGSGVVSYVDALIVGSGAADIISVVEYDVALTTADQAGFRDRRIAGAPACTCRRATNVAQLGTDRALIDVPASEGILIPWTGVLKEGQGLAVHSETVNQSLRLIVYWAERESVQ